MGDEMSGIVISPVKFSRFIYAPIVYLAGWRSDTWPVLFGTCVAAFLAVLAAWMGFIISVQTLLRSGTQEFNISTIRLHVDGASLLMAGCVLMLGTLVILFSVLYVRRGWRRKILRHAACHDGIDYRAGLGRYLLNLWVWFEGWPSPLFAGGFIANKPRHGSRDEVSRPKRNGFRVGTDRNRNGAGTDGTLDMTAIHEAISGTGVNHFAMLGADRYF